MLCKLLFLFVFCQTLYRATFTWNIYFIFDFSHIFQNYSVLTSSRTGLELIKSLKAYSKSFSNPSVLPLRNELPIYLSRSIIMTFLISPKQIIRRKLIILIWKMDSSSNRSQYKCPTPKVARYLHRIEQIMGNRSRTPSPINSRVQKSMKPSSLDHYLKYELTFKILINFVDRKLKESKRIFFNNFRTAQKQQVEKIYRFVSIQKLDDGKMSVDSTIAAKILLNYLKSLFRSKKKEYFDDILSHEAVRLVESHLIDTKHSLRSNPKFMPLIQFFIRKISVKNHQFFSSLKQLQKRKQLSYFHTKYLVKTLKPLFLAELRCGFIKIKETSEQKNRNVQKIRSFFNYFHQYLKKNCINALIHLPQKQNCEQKFDPKEEEEVLFRESEVKEKEDIIQRVYSFTNFINIALISSIKRSQAMGFSSLLVHSHKVSLSSSKKTSVLLIAEKIKFLLNQTNHQFFLKLTQTDSSLKEKKSRKIDILALQKINKLANFGHDKCLQQQAFKSITKVSLKRSILQDGLFLLDEILMRVNMKKSFQAIKNQKKQKFQEATMLYKMLNKLIFIRIIQSFSKMKVQSRTILKKKQSQSIMSADKSYWMNEAAAFLEERERNKPKIDEIWNKLQDLAISTENRPLDKNSQLKVVLSPSNRASNLKLL